MEQVLSFLIGLTFTQTATIALGVFASDFIAGITAALRSGRHIKSSVMGQGLSTKATGYFNYFIIGLAFYIASRVGGTETAYLEGLASLIVLVPTLPELLSVFENIKIIRTGIDTKPKGGDDDVTKGSE
jgi:hypothetical protein